MTKFEEVEKGTVQLLDVRTLAEWEEGHAEHAIHIPVDVLVKGNHESLDSSKRTYVYCAAGGRAGTATQYLTSLGFTAENVGGLQDWERAQNSK